MKKTLLLFCFLFQLMLPYVVSATNVSGAISSNTTWNLAGSPYIVTAPVAVMGGYTLTIDPGVVVKFDAATSIQFFGTCRAIGTQNQPITFTSNSNSPAPGDWGYILFNTSSPAYYFPSNSGSVMNYCIVEYAGGANVTWNGVIRMNHSYPLINNCTIRNNSKTAIKAWSLTSLLYVLNSTIHYNNVDTGSVYASGGTLIVNGCNISNNTSSISTSNDYSTAGVFTMNSTMRVKNSNFNANNSSAICGYKSGSNAQTDSIYLNTIANNLKNGIYYFSYVTNSNRTHKILNNVITNNTAKGIYFNYNAYIFTNVSSTSNTFIITDNVIENNYSDAIYYLYHSENQSAYCSLNSYTISNNSIDNNTGNGIYFYSNSNATNTYSNTYSISNNRITNNSANGIYYYHFSGPIQWSYPSPLYSNNYIFSNNIINENQGSGVNLYLFPNSTNSNSSNNINLQKNKFIKNNSDKGGGVKIQTSSDCKTALTIQENIFADNISNGDAGAIYLDISEEASSSITTNTFINNAASTTSAIYYQGEGLLQANKNTLVYNNSNGNDTLTMAFLKKTQSFNNNNIYNSNCASPPYYLWYDDYNGNTLNAQDCYWRKNTSQNIDCIVYDFFDDQNLAIVDHSNFKALPDTSAPVTPVENVVKTDLGGGNIQLTWTANLEIDLTGYKVYWGNPTGYSFTNVTDVGNVTSYTISGVSINDTLVVTAYDSQANGTDDQVEGHESWFSDDYTVPVISISANNPTTFCQGGSVTLTANSGSSYLWSNGETTQSIIVATSGNYSVLVSGSNNCDCVSRSNVFPVTVNPLPVVTLTGIESGYCSDTDSILLVGSPSGGTFNGTGISGNYFVPSLANIGINTITYSYTDGNGCSGTSAPRTVLIHQSPTASFYVQNNDPTIVFTETANNEVSYNWFFDDGTPNTTEQNPEHTYLENGTFNVVLCVESSSGCIDCDTNQVVILTTGIIQNNLYTDIEIFPNPTNSNISIRAEKADNFTVNLFNNIGQLMLSSNFTGKVYNINLNQFSSGIYLLGISNRIGELKMFKIIKE